MNGFKVQNKSSSGELWITAAAQRKSIALTPQFDLVLQSEHARSQLMQIT